MGALVSRRKQAKVGSKNKSTQVSEQVPAPVPPEIVSKAASANIGDGLVHHSPHQLSLFEVVAPRRPSPENKKRRESSLARREVKEVEKAVVQDSTGQCDYNNLPGTVNVESNDEECATKATNDEGQESQPGDSLSATEERGRSKTRSKSVKRDSSLLTSHSISVTEVANPLPQPQPGSGEPTTNQTTESSRTEEEEQDENANIIKEGTILADMRNADLYGGCTDEEIRWMATHVSQSSANPFQKKLMERMAGNAGSAKGTRFKEVVGKYACRNPRTYSRMYDAPDLLLTLEEILQNNQTRLDTDVLEPSALTGTYGTCEAKAKSKCELRECAPRRDLREVTLSRALKLQRRCESSSFDYRVFEEYSTSTAGSSVTESSCMLTAPDSETIANEADMEDSLGYGNEDNDVDNNIDDVTEDNDDDNNIDDVIEDTLDCNADDRVASPLDEGLGITSTSSQIHDMTVSECDVLQMTDTAQQCGAKNFKSPSSPSGPSSSSSSSHTRLNRPVAESGITRKEQHSEHELATTEVRYRQNWMQTLGGEEITTLEGDNTIHNDVQNDALQTYACIEKNRKNNSDTVIEAQIYIDQESQTEKEKDGSQTDTRLYKDCDDKAEEKQDKCTKKEKKTLMEMQEAEGVAMLVLTSNLTDTNKNEVRGGAGDAISVGTPSESTGGVDTDLGTQVYSDHSKTSCQLQQLMAADDEAAAIAESSMINSLRLSQRAEQASNNDGGAASMPSSTTVDERRTDNECGSCYESSDYERDQQNRGLYEPRQRVPPVQSEAAAAGGEQRRLFSTRSTLSNNPLEESASSSGGSSFVLLQVQPIPSASSMGGSAACEDDSFRSDSPTPRTRESGSAAAEIAPAYQIRAIRDPVQYQSAENASYERRSPSNVTIWSQHIEVLQLQNLMQFTSDARVEVKHSDTAVKVTNSRPDQLNLQPAQSFSYFSGSQASVSSHCAEGGDRTDCSSLNSKVEIFEGSLTVRDQEPVQVEGQALEIPVHHVCQRDEKSQSEDCMSVEEIRTLQSPDRMATPRQRRSWTTQHSDMIQSGLLDLPDTEVMDFQKKENSEGVQNYPERET